MIPMLSRAITAAALLAALSLAPAQGQDAAAAPKHPLESAVEALNGGDFAAAAGFLEKALEDDPNHVQARFNLAYAYGQLERPADAVEQYRKLLVIDPNVPEARMNLGVLLLQSDRPAEAAEQLEALLALRPDDLNATFYLAHALAAAERFADAVPAYEKAVALDPGRAQAHLGLGRSLARLERLEAAEPHYRTAVELDPSLDSMLLELGEAYEQAAALDRALPLYREYAANHPEDAAVAERIGLLTLDSGGGAEAIEALEAAVRRSPTSANKAALAEAYYRADDLEKAVTLWQEAIAADPGALKLRLRLANELLKAAHFQQAGGQYLAVTKLAPENAAAWNGLAFCLYKVENFPAALEALAESAKHETPATGNLYLRAIVEDKLMLFEEAKASYEAFLARMPDMEDEVWKAEQRLKAIEKNLDKR